MTERKATVTRNTLESQITITVNLDGSGCANLDTPVPFLNHMIDQIARHGLIDIDIQATGDTHIDDHHTVEDIGITLGMAVAEAIGDKKRLNALWPCLCAIGRVSITCGVGFFWSPRPVHGGRLCAWSCGYL